MKIKEKSALSDIKKAAQLLKSGGVVIFPTDTVYGIGCIYDNKEGLLKISKIKNRPQNLPFPILVSSISQAQSIVNMNRLAMSLAKKHWPGGLTIIANSIDGASKLGVRMPDSKIALSLIKEAGSPVIGTSANFHGQKSVADFESLDSELVKLAGYVLKGQCEGGVESTVVAVSDNSLKIIRQGAVKLT